MHNHTCPVCSAEFTGRATRVYCSRKCRERNKYPLGRVSGVDRQPVTKGVRVCVECGEVFEGTRAAKTCSQKCRGRVGHKQKMASGYYQKPEVKARQAAYQRGKYRADIADGKESGERLAKWAVHGKGEDATCTATGCDRVMFSKLFCRAHYNAEFGYDFGNDYQRRAERWGVEFEVFSRAEIFDRDGWVCGICSEPIDRDLLHPDPMSVSLDHIIPMSKGGGHVPLNVTCAHLFCNLSKGNRYDESGSLAGAA